MNTRELNRKERGTAEYHRMLNRYVAECGPCVSYYLPPEEIKKILRNKYYIPPVAERR